jgi:hypothetical protein
MTPLFRKTEWEGGGIVKPVSQETCLSGAVTKSFEERIRPIGIFASFAHFLCLICGVFPNLLNPLVLRG